jgi:hypothetical protein
MAQKTIKAKKVRTGDYLPGLDNGYVFDEPERDPYVVFDNRFPVNVGSQMVLITFHDNEGNENYLIVGKDMPITVERP